MKIREFAPGPGDDDEEGKLKSLARQWLHYDDPNTQNQIQKILGSMGWSIGYGNDEGDVVILLNSEGDYLEFTALELDDQ